MAVVTSVRLLPPLRAQRIEACLLPIRATRTAGRVGVQVCPGAPSSRNAPWQHVAQRLRGMSDEGLATDGNSLPSGVLTLSQA